ncbi:pteridine-dependent deoxygenase [Pseudoxanthomonas kalamensis DSM 18571]|uniref:chorismate transformation enzyme, FkbO/Hyg5 family n=1 Tax=Pseudoxanthomonas kalamensis TaxID=289483 RepID=UPI0013912F54|nr:pteridine-dependent deoxygenase [Pseudoxanthomonas kalamensis]KAF1712209.1 pteridine-dependent deoxygenase [Pseudoxanthomonas kalamensis DSM 18571]
MSFPPDRLTAAPRLAVDHVPARDPADWLARPDTLAVFGFGGDAPATETLADPRYLRLPLQPLGATALEVWRGSAAVGHGSDDGIAWASDGELLFGRLQLAEAGDGILAAAERAYARLAGFWRASAFPHVLRIWNYFDAITDGEGDDERYRQFCIGRVRGLGEIDPGSLPAATAIGYRDGSRVLHVYWLAARRPGQPLENPRQVSAWRYPRQYGPQSPSFARAMLPPAGTDWPLFLSGTASIVGHASHHAGSLAAQLDETLANLGSLVDAARVARPALPPQLDASSRLKIYLRDAADADALQALLAKRLPADLPRLILQADVCRRELQVEIEGMHGVIVAP